MKSLLKTLFGFLVLCFSIDASLLGAEPSTNFPKPPPPLELAPRMGRPFGENAVFQQNMPIPVWGRTLPGADVQVTFDTQKRSAKAGANERFDVTLDALPADKLKSVDDAPAGRTLTVVTRQDRTPSGLCHARRAVISGRI